MYFTSSIPRDRVPRTRELSGLDTVREPDSLLKLWKKTNGGIYRGSALTQNTSEVMRQMARLRKPVWVNYQFHPFKVYNVPPEYCVTPEDSWRTFQVRDGLIELGQSHSYNNGSLRPYTSVSGTDGVVEIPVLNESKPDYQTELYTYGGTMNPIRLDGYNETTDESLPAQFVLTDAAANPGTNWRGAAFYIKLEDLSGLGIFTPSIRARMFDQTSFNGFSFDNPYIIPLAVVYARVRAGSYYVPSSPSNLLVWQFQYGNLVNRVPVLPGPVGSALNIRGDWVADSLSGQNFEPGDVVTVDTTSTAGGITLTVKSPYVYTSSGIESTPPPGANWIVLSTATIA